MAHLIENSFSSYDLTTEETLEGRKLTITQRQTIQNDLAAASEQMLGLEYDLNDPNDYLRSASYQQGMIAAYRFLLNADREVREVQLATEAMNEGLPVANTPEHNENTAAIFEAASDAFAAYDE